MYIYMMAKTGRTHLTSFQPHSPFHYVEDQGHSSSFFSFAYARQEEGYLWEDHLYGKDDQEDDQL